MIPKRRQVLQQPRNPVKVWHHDLRRRRLNVLHLSLQDPVLCLERSVIDSSPEMLFPEVCQGRLYPFDIKGVIGLGDLVRQGLKDSLAPVIVDLHAGQGLVGEFLLLPWRLPLNWGAWDSGASMGHAWRLPSSGTTGDPVEGLATSVTDQTPGERG
jgi:hypothetical protein